MKKKIIYSLVAALIVVLLFFIVSLFGNRNNFFSNPRARSAGDIYNDFKKNCSVATAVAGKYQNNIFDLVSDYPENLVICEKYPFNEKKEGSEIYFWDKTDFESPGSLNGPVAILYINKTLLLNNSLMGLYDLEEFTDSGFSVDGKSIFKKEIQEKTCNKEACKFRIYKFAIGNNPALIMEYKNIENFISSLNNFTPRAIQ